MGLASQEDAAHVICKPVQAIAEHPAFLRIPVSWAHVWTGCGHEVSQSQHQCAADHLLRAVCRVPLDL